MAAKKTETVGRRNQGRRQDLDRPWLRDRKPAGENLRPDQNLPARGGKSVTKRAAGQRHSRTKTGLERHESARENRRGRKTQSSDADS
jgi:hypothetical protein